MILLFKLFFFEIILIESRIICEISPGNETKSNIRNLISASGSKNVTIVGNNIESLWLEAWAYMDINAHFSSPFCSCKYEYGETHYK